MRLLLDANLSPRLAEPLAAAGHDVVHVADVGLLRATDVEIVRWCVAQRRVAVTELGERFSPYGSTFQIGQAVNRSKWGFWTRTEFLEIYRDASVVLRTIDGVRLAGPAVIDFELQVTAAEHGRCHRDPSGTTSSRLAWAFRRTWRTSPPTC